MAEEIIYTVNDTQEKVSLFFGGVGEVNTIDSIVDGEPTGSDRVINVVSLIQAEYDAGSKIATTLYIITD